MSAGIRTECAGCGARLHANNLTGLCAECKLIARNRRLIGQPTDTTNPIPYGRAITTITDLLGGRIIHAEEQTRMINVIAVFLLLAATLGAGWRLTR